MALTATRDAFGEALADLGAEDERLVVVDADDALATRTAIFARRFPDRFVNVGAAEQNLIGVAAGLALAGKVPVVSTHAVFLCGRAFEQIRNAVCYGALDVKLVGSHGGISVGHDGPTHFAVEDIALMRVLPGMTVIVPADAAETKRALRAAVGRSGPTYLRVGRAPVPELPRGDEGFEVGRATLLEEGDDVAIIACGLMVARSLAAAAVLRREGLRATVLNAHTVKPLDAGRVAEAARRCGAVVVAEEHSVVGGLGGAVAEALCVAAPTPVEFVGVRDTFAESGEPETLLTKYGLDPADIASAAHRAVARKG
jgi:transketolase